MTAETDVDPQLAADLDRLRNEIDQGRYEARFARELSEIPIPDLVLLAMRKHGNFVEYVPFFMIMFAALELNGASPLFLHGLGLAMILARILHAVGLKADTIESLARGIGAGGTLLVTLVATGMLLYQFVQA